MTMSYLHPTTTNAPDLEDYYMYDMGYNATGPKTDIKFQILLCFFAGIALFGVLGNAVVLWYLAFWIRRSPFTVYILNLAIADLIYLLMFILLITLSILRAHGIIKKYLFTDVQEDLFLLGYITSQDFLTAISLERWLSVMFPIWYRCRRNKHQSTIVCAATWVFTCVPMAVQYVCDSEEIWLIFSALQTILNLMICLPLILLSNLALVIQICRKSRRHHPPRVYILIISTAAAFLFLCAPMSLFNFLLRFDIYYFQYLHIAILSCTINSSLNPVIYFLVGSFRSQRIKCSIPTALKRAFKEHSESLEQQ
ncbi:proto-oncogene Mas-like [Lissotriton helveticus]